MSVMTVMVCTDCGSDLLQPSDDGLCGLCQLDGAQEARELPTVLDALRYLAGRCDGARTEDGCGFNGLDANFGHSLAQQARLTPRQEEVALRMLRKYRRQLERGGLDYVLLHATPAPVTMVTSARVIGLHTGHLAIRFPYDSLLIMSVKELPNRRWDGDRRAWLVPLDHLLQVEEFAETHDFEFTPEASERLSELRAAAEAEQERDRLLIEASKAASTDTEIPVAGLYPFQRAGAAYALAQRRTWIADEMGLGKTVQALAALETDQAFPALIICPASLKLNWMRETRHWLPGRSVRVIGGAAPKKGGQLLLDTGSDVADVEIINYDIVSRRLEGLVDRYKALVLDESHMIKNHRSLRTKAVRNLSKQLTEPDPMILLLSGTPLVNRPGELVSQLQVMRRLDDLGGYKKFIGRYCGGSGQGVGFYLDELNDKLRATCMVRRLKADVLKELPPRTWAIQPVEITNRSEYDRAERDFLGWVSAVDPDKLSSAERAEAIVKIQALRRFCAQGKLQAATEWTRDFLDGDGKLVVFAHHRDVVRGLAEALAPFGARVIAGDTSQENRQAAVDAFQEDPEVRVIVCSLKAAGVGLTLTAASNVAFVELDWTPGGMQQALDRCHRIGQRDAVTGWQLIGPVGIDAYMLRLLDEKRQVVDQVTDGTSPAGVEDEGMLTALVTAYQDEYR